MTEVGERTRAGAATALCLALGIGLLVRAAADAPAQPITAPSRTATASGATEPRVVPLAPPTSSSPAPSARARPSLVPVWRARRVTAGGVRQWIECAGTGPVTIVVIAGLHADHRMWSLVLAPFARTTRTCIYDRPGLGASPPRSPHRIVSAARHAGELAELLTAAHVPGPFVVVGHSYGGLVARAFTARFRSHVAGLMLIEGVGPNDSTSHYWHEGGDTVDVWASERAAATMRLGSVPLVVEAAQDPNRSYWGGPSYGESASALAQWRANQRAAARLSSQSTFVVVRRSAHVIEHDRPDAVVAGVRLLVRSIEAHHRLPRCALSAYGVQPLC